MYQSKTLIRILSIPALITTIINYLLFYILKINPIIYGIYNVLDAIIIWLIFTLIFIPCLLLSLFPNKIYFWQYLAMISASILLAWLMQFFDYLGWYPYFLGFEALLVGYILNEKENVSIKYISSRPFLPFVLTLIGGIILLILPSIDLFVEHIALNFSSYLLSIELKVFFSGLSTLIVSLYMYNNDEARVKLSGVLAMLFSTLSTVNYLVGFFILPLIGGILAIVWKPTATDSLSS